MSLLISALVTFLVVILILYLINMLPVDGRVKQIARVIVILVGVLSLPQPATIIVALIPITNHGGTKPRRRKFLTLRVSVSPWFVWVNVAAIMDVRSASRSSQAPATRRHPRCSHSSQKQGSVCRSVVRPALAWFA